MRLVGYVAREEHWQPQSGPPEEGIRVETDVAPATTLKAACDELVRLAGFQPEEHFYWPTFVVPGTSPMETVGTPRVVIADDGEFNWIEGSYYDVTFADLKRTHEARLMRGDPYQVYLQWPEGGDGVLPGWEDFISWTLEFAYLGGVTLFAKAVRNRYRRWQARGSAGPFTFAHLVATRDEWDDRDVEAWFGMSKREARDVLEALGFERVEEGSTLWRLSSDPKRLEFRNLIRRGYLHMDRD